MNDFTTIQYGETKSFPVFEKDIFYRVVFGQYVIPNKEWVEKHMTLKNGKYSLSFKLSEMMNFEVYLKLSLIAKIIVYLIFVAAVFGVYKLVLSIYSSIF